MKKIPLFPFRNLPWANSLIGQRVRNQICQREQDYGFSQISMARLLQKFTLKNDKRREMKEEITKKRKGRILKKVSKI